MRSPLYCTLLDELARACKGGQEGEAPGGRPVPAPPLAPPHQQPPLRFCRPALACCVQEVIPSTIPGIVLGVLSLVGFILFLGWMCASCCCACWAPCCKCCRRPAAPAADDMAATQQFIASDGQVRGLMRCTLLPARGAAYAAPRLLGC